MTQAQPEPQAFGSFPLSLHFLMSRLNSGNDQVRMWAAYQLVEHWRDSHEQFIERLWNTGIPEVMESAIHLIAMERSIQFAFPVLRTFNTGEHGLKPAAAEALGALHYEPAVKPLREWFEWVFEAPETNLLDLESSVKSLLLLDHWRYWEELYTRLDACQQNHAVFSVLFKSLAFHTENPDQAERIASAYRAPRDIFHDFHIPQALLEAFGNPNISRFLQARLNGGYPLSVVYQEAMHILGVETSGKELKGMIESLSRCGKTQEGVAAFLKLAPGLLDLIAPGEPETPIIKAFLEGSRAWVEDWDEAVVKVREVEYHFLVSLPLTVLMARVERKCFENPIQEATRISNIYQSPLLSPVFMGRVLSLLCSQEGGTVVARMGTGPLSGWLRDEEKDALWKLITGQLDDVDYPFEQILPQPWNLSNPEVMNRLEKILIGRFSMYLESGRHQAVDYALEVFKRQGSVDALDLLVAHFDTLINRNYYGLIELMTHIPDRRFIPLLVRHHREGEFELNRMIRFICNVHNQPFPEEVGDEEKKEVSSSLPATVRLQCPSCESSYQYVLKMLYVNEERIEQRQIPTAQDVWSPNPFECKNCGKAVPLLPEESYLNDLYTELMADRILHVTNRNESLLNHIHLIPFPQLRGKTLHPDRFLREVEHLSVEKDETGEAIPNLLELGKFRLEIGDLLQAKQAFQRVQAGPVSYPLALYYLGVVAFQEKNPFEARIFFSRFVESSNREEYDLELDNPVDMAHHYLKLLEKREFKRSHFRIVPK